MKVVHLANILCQSETLPLEILRHSEGGNRSRDLEREVSCAALHRERHGDKADCPGIPDKYKVLAEWEMQFGELSTSRP